MRLPNVRPIVRRIVERFHPKTVILFGSYAYGEPHEGSDVDLLIVTQNPPRKQEGWKVTSELGKSLPVPLQLVFMSPEEFEETKDVVGGLAYPAHHWGRILHEIGEAKQVQTAVLERLKNYLSQGRPPASSS